MIPPHSVNRFAPLFEIGCRPKGTLALAVRSPNSGTLVEAYAPDISPGQITELWPLIEDSFKESSGEGLSAQRIRFAGRQRELHCFRRADGEVLAVLMDCAKADTRVPELQQFAVRFELCAGEWAEPRCD